MKIKSLKKINDLEYEITADSYQDMKIPIRIYGSESIIQNINSVVFSQINNIASLPGIVDAAIYMPDENAGYGAPNGTVVAVDPKIGIISPGIVGFDINCGMRLISTSLTIDEVSPMIKNLVGKIYKNIPSGIETGGILQLNESDFEEAMIYGTEWGIKNGYGDNNDLLYCEESGRMSENDASSVSARAKERGISQLGSMGTGNHFIEIQVVKNIFDKENAEAFGITGEGQIVIMLHCGSRGFGHQIATDYIWDFIKLQEKLGYNLPYRDLAYAIFYSDEGQNYFKAMNCAANIAFLNRLAIKHRITEIIFELFGSKNGLKVETVYDVCHSMAKLEEHIIDGETKKLLIHRKGATRAFPPGSKYLPEKYLSSGQPVFLCGSMEAPTYLLRGTESGAKAFYSNVHGSGRLMSRNDAKKKFNGKNIQKSMKSQGIYVKFSSYEGLAEEAGRAYNDVEETVHTAQQAGLCDLVAKFEPIGNIKG
ncbi:MAG: RtcB family protein [Spirochaetes bacterium]|nr:RtcB family protein [Spirochaetota bacterium]